MCHCAPDADAASPSDPTGLRRRVNELYHNLQADDFDRLHRFRHRAERTFWVRDVVPRLHAARCRFGVDLCTGTGFVPLTLLERLDPSTRILCLDISEGVLGRARACLAEFQHQVTTRVCDARELPLEANSADWITLNAGLHHIPDPERTLREVDRVLKPGGFFCLGHEPNAAFFASRGLVRTERLIWHAAWYGSPRQNLRRIRRKLGLDSAAYEKSEHLREINATLTEEGLITRPLSQADLRHLVDVHSHGEDNDDDHPGFYPRDLLAADFLAYHVERMVFTDFGGEMLLRHPWLRAAFDRLLGTLFPERGRLFSWIIRKPSGEEAH